MPGSRSQASSQVWVRVWVWGGRAGDLAAMALAEPPEHMFRTALVPRVPRSAGTFLLFYIVC